VSDSSPLLDRAAIEEAFRLLLGERLAKRSITRVFASSLPPLSISWR
jgi:hypothetical protein